MRPRRAVFINLKCPECGKCEIAPITRGFGMFGDDRVAGARAGKCLNCRKIYPLDTMAGIVMKPQEAAEPLIRRVSEALPNIKRNTPVKHIRWLRGLCQRRDAKLVELGERPRWLEALELKIAAMMVKG